MTRKGKDVSVVGLALLLASLSLMACGGEQPLGIGSLQQEVAMHEKTFGFGYAHPPVQIKWTDHVNTPPTGPYCMKRSEYDEAHGVTCADGDYYSSEENRDGFREANEDQLFHLIVCDRDDIGGGYVYT